MSKKEIKFHYFSDYRVSSLLIRARLATKFQHVGIEMEGVGYIDSTLAGGGVAWRPLPDNIAHTSTILVDEDKFNEILEFLNDINGSGYDIRALLGFALSYRSQNEDTWFCSEVGRIVFEMATDIIVKHYVLIAPGALRLMTDMYQKIQTKQ